MCDHGQLRLMLLSGPLHMRGCVSVKHVPQTPTHRFRAKKHTANVKTSTDVHIVQNASIDLRRVLPEVKNVESFVRVPLFFSRTPTSLPQWRGTSVKRPDQISRGTRETFPNQCGRQSCLVNRCEIVGATVWCINCASPRREIWNMTESRLHTSKYCGRHTTS